MMSLPSRVPLSLTWGGVSKSVTAYWFQYESNPELNSNAYDVASQLVNENFPGLFGSERLVQQVVESVLHATCNLDEMVQVEGNHPAPPPGGAIPAPSRDGEKEGKLRGGRGHSHTNTSTLLMISGSVEV